MARYDVRGVAIEAETRGAADAPAFVLIRGLSTQMIQWPEIFLDAFVDAGFRVVVFDNRDAGLSQKFDDAGTPAMADLLAGRAEAPYGVSDMAGDVVGLLDTLGIDRAHVAGMSLGGMVAQRLAIEHGDRCRTVTSVMSSSGAPGLPSGTPEAMRVLMERPPEGADRETIIQHQMRSQVVIGSPGFPMHDAELRAYCERAYDRCYTPSGTARQMAAVLTDTTRHERLAEIRVPFQVVHGADDPLIPLACGEDTAKRANGAPIVVIPGMGHDITEALSPVLAEKLIAFARANPA